MLCGGLALVVALELLHGEMPPATAIHAAPKSAVAVTPAVTLPPIETLGEVVARPLFLPSRRPLPPVSTEPAKPIARFTLAGVVLADGRRIALIQSGTSPPPVMVTVGGVIDGWTVTAIERDRVALRAAGETAELSLRDNAPPYRGPPPRLPPPRPVER